MSISSDLPEHLKNYNNLAQNIRSEFEGLSSKDKGDAFERFVKNIIPATELGADFQTPELKGGSWDKGIDLVAESKDGRSRLFIQAKLWLDRVDEIDKIIRKFQEWHLERHQNKPPVQLGLFEKDEKTGVNDCFMVISLSKLKSIVEKYSKSYNADDFYKEWTGKGQLVFVDGSEILSILQTEFIKQHQSPLELTVNLELPPLKMGNVYISVISSDALRKLYKEFKNALFFENVRDFLGWGQEKEGRTSPNLEILKTLRSNPDKFLERNNGIVFKAKKVMPVKNDDKQLVLIEGSVVNGCQTTICVSEVPTNPCKILVKIVEADSLDSQWEIAEAANYQNKISYIDLKLAKNIRPQIVQRAAAIARLTVVRSESSAIQLMDEIYGRRVVYEEIRLLYIGFFSRSPNNVISSNYTELDYPLIERFYNDDPLEQEIFNGLFELQNSSQQALVSAKETFDNPRYKKTYARFYEQGVQYRCFVSLLTMCTFFNVNLDEDNLDADGRYNQRKELIEMLNNQLPSKVEEFKLYYQFAFKVWMDAVTLSDDSDEKVRRNMNVRTMRANFTNLFHKVLSEVDLHKKVQSRL